MIGETIQETAKEVVKSFTKNSDIVTEPIKQRMGHPFIGSFAISWILFNWKPIAYFIFTKSSIEHKIIYIEQNFSNWLFLFLAPFIAACFYSVGLKWFDHLCDYLNTTPVKTKNKYETTLKIDQITNEIEIVEKQIDLDNAKAENKPIKDLNNKIALLSLELTGKEEQNSNLQGELLTKTKEFNSLQNENYSLKNRISNFSELLAKSNEKSEKDSMEILRIFKDITPKDQYIKIFNKLYKTSPNIFSDNHLSIFTDYKNLENNFSTEYILNYINDYDYSLINESLLKIDKRISTERSLLINEKNEEVTKITVFYPDSKMLIEIDSLLKDQ